MSVRGGLIEVEKELLKGYKSIRTLFKVPKKPTGFTYLGSYTIPFETCSYVVKIEATETSASGMREAVVADQLINSNQISKMKDGFEGWLNDPYDPEFRRGSLMNISDHPRYDAQFPDHPLTQTREILEEVKDKIEFNPQLDSLIPFNGAE